MTFKTAIVEDDENAHADLRDLLKRYSREKNKEFDVRHYPDGLTFLDHLESFDIVFMDIHLPGMDGLEVAREMRKHNLESFLFFVTDLAQYAIKGYEVDAIDYIVKPVIYDHLAMRLDKVVTLLEDTHNQPKITVKSDSGIHLLKPDDIYYVDILGHRLSFHTKQGEYSTYGSLNEVEKELPTADFIRCNHCYLINMKYVTSIEKNAIVVMNEELAMSRTKRKAFLEAFSEYQTRHN